MKLAELHPKWVVAGENRHGMGISFDCPAHRNHKLAVMFENPIDGKPRAKESRNFWHRSGESFETLTLTPSVDASNNTPEKHLEFGKCWHGCITNGETQ